MLRHDLDVDPGAQGRVEADVEHFHLAGVVRARQEVKTELRVTQRKRDLGPSSVLVGRAGLGVDAGGQVDGEERAASLRQGIESARHDAFERALAARTEHGIDHGIAAMQVVRDDAGHGGLVRLNQVYIALPHRGEVGVVFRAFRQQEHPDVGAIVVKIARRHEAIAAVVARAHEDQDTFRPCAAQPACDGLGNVAPRRLHEPRRRSARREGGRLDSTHLVGRNEFHSSPRRTSRSMSSDFSSS